ncbi:MAG: chitobiase/beta-hexosaminidase C-terminal domain-containing protein, partial [Syntrophales bacterium LBB04]|nr:chitobiase/beta-hexosaminidase C-terminal domain-containing protein [Syntrophales bacterium LBB04]
MKNHRPASVLRLLGSLTLALVIGSCQPPDRDNPHDPGSVPGKVTLPFFTPEGGVYGGSQQVTIGCNTAGASIRYTLDGGNPTDSSSLYADPLTVSKTTTIKAVAKKSGMTASDVASSTYAITAQLSEAKTLSTFGFQGYSANPGTINEAAGTVSVMLPYGVARTGLVAVFTTTGTSVTVGGVAQISGTTANDFLNPVSYRVTAQDGTFKDYVVGVVNAASDAKAITAFSIQGYDSRESRESGLQMDPRGQDIGDRHVTDARHGGGVVYGS